MVVGIIVLIDATLERTEWNKKANKRNNMECDKKVPEIKKKYQQQWNSKLEKNMKYHKIQIFHSPKILRPKTKLCSCINVKT